MSAAIAGGGDPAAPPLAGRLPAAARWLAAASALAVVAGAGWWGLTAPREGEEGAHAVGAGHDGARAGHDGAPAVPQTSRIPGGLLRLDGVLDRTPAHVMLGMDPDPVAEGARRVNVAVTAAATGSSTLEVDARAFRLEGDVDAPIPPRAAQLGSGRVPPGAAVSGMLMFEVPRSASRLLLAYPGLERPFELRLPPAPATRRHGGAAGKGGGGPPADAPPAHAR